jgi:hypothetical protein
MVPAPIRCAIQPRTGQPSTRKSQLKATRKRSRRSQRINAELRRLTCLELPVAGRLDVGEVDETATRHFWRLDYAPAFVSVEPFYHSRHCSSLLGQLPRHGADCAIRLSRRHPLMPHCVSRRRRKPSTASPQSQRDGNGVRQPSWRSMRRALASIRWSSSSTALELIACGRVRPTAAYFRAGHLLLDSLTRSLPQHLPPAQARDIVSQPPVPAGSRHP